VDAPRRTASRSRNGRAAGTRRRGRPRGSGSRAQQALAVVRQNPGITVAELARQLNISPPNYMYRVMGTLESEGAVRKEGRGYTAT
jgi:hypothetical protein